MNDFQVLSVFLMGLSGQKQCILEIVNRCKAICNILDPLMPWRLEMLRSTLIAVCLLGSVTGAAMAQEFTAVSTIDRMVETQNEDGTVSVTFLSADRVTPGENLYYRLSYDNPTAEMVENVNLVMNVPSEVTYSENSVNVNGQNIIVAFSTDGGQSFSPRGDLQVSANGQPRAAVSEDITNIRWTFVDPILPNTEGEIGFKAVVR